MTIGDKRSSKQKLLEDMYLDPNQRLTLLFVINVTVKSQQSPNFTSTWVNQILWEKSKFENLPNSFLSLGLSTALEFETEKIIQNKLVY